MILSHNGWPASKNRSAIGIKSFQVGDLNISLACAEAVAPLLVNFAWDFHRLIEPIDKGQLDDWGYAFRPIRGTTVHLSNHASGTAIDLNATKHPLGASGTFKKAQERTIRELCRHYGLRWGGDYEVRKDEMHFEINISPAKAKRLIADLGLTHAQSKNRPNR